MATETTDTMTTALQALAAMEDRAAHIRAVATRLIAEHGDSLPQLSGVHLEASTNRAFVGLQPRTEADARLWAQALNVPLEKPEPNRSQHEGGYYVHVTAKFVVDGVDVRLGSADWVSTRDAAGRSEAVAA